MTQSYRLFRCRYVKQFNERITGLNLVHYSSDVVIRLAFWRLRYQLSLRNLAEMFLIRGFVFGYATAHDGEARLTPALAADLRR